MRSKLSEFVPRIMLVAAFTLAVAACGGNNEEKMATERRMVTSPPATESSAPTVQPNTPAPSANETVPGGIETAARRLLADELEEDEVNLKLVSSQGVAWSDASLGCPQDGMFYAQVISPGYKLVFDLEGASHAVHTNSDGSSMVICGDGR